MTRRFVILTNELSREQEERFLAYFKDKGYGWWHWLDNAWLIAMVDKTIEVGDLRDKLNEIAPSVHKLVMEVSPVSWSGYGPSGEERNMFDWLHRNWSSWS